MNKFFARWRDDLPAGLVVFLVALPLCLGVGLASTNIEGVDGMPNIFAGVIAGIVGGIVVGIFSNSRKGVSGPAAGLITIVIAAIITLGSFEGFLVAIVISGFIQLIAGFLGMGILASYFPSSVIKGMLAAIGITLILKEIPHALGYDADFFGDQAFLQPDGHNTFSELIYALNAFHPGSILIAIVSLLILIAFDTKKFKNIALFKILPGALFVVVISIGLNLLFSLWNSQFSISAKHLVQLPVADSIKDVATFFSFPDFSFLSNPNIYVIALTLALVGSLETLLSVEATDKLDQDKNKTPKNRELKAQGIGNIISGMLGGLPITQVIVRSSANISSGGKTKLSAIFHGLLLLVSVIFIPVILNMIPLAALAAILIMIGYKLARIQLFKYQYKLGFEQFIPFIATIVGVLFTDLLKGIAIGMAFSFFYILRKNFRNNYSKVTKVNGDHKEIVIHLSEEVTFLNKGSIQETLNSIEENSIVIIDGTRCKEIDHDVLEIIQDFKLFTAKEKNIELTTINIPSIKGTIGH